jgi:preprotein translocase subunit SecA
MGFNDILKTVFGNKSDRDMKKIAPIVEKVKAAYPEIEQLSNDELRARTCSLSLRRRLAVSTRTRQSR